MLQMEQLLKALGVFYATRPTLEERRAGAKQSLIHQGRNQTTANAVDQQDYEVDQKGSRAVSEMIKHLQDKDRNGNLGKRAHELWAWAQTYGVEQRAQYALIFTEALSQTMLEDFGGDLEKFLNTFNARYRELHNVSEEAMTMDRCIRWLLKNLGEVGSPTGYLREQVNEIYTLLSAESELVTPGSDFVAAYLRDGDPPTLVGSSEATRLPLKGDMAKSGRDLTGWARKIHLQ